MKWRMLTKSCLLHSPKRNPQRANSPLFLPCFRQAPVIDFIQRRNRWHLINIGIIAIDLFIYCDNRIGVGFLNFVIESGEFLTDCKEVLLC